jgi:hypothetical protein
MPIVATRISDMKAGVSSMVCSSERRGRSMATSKTAKGAPALKARVDIFGLRTSGLTDMFVKLTTRGSDLTLS